MGLYELVWELQDTVVGGNSSKILLGPIVDATRPRRIR
jgi:hypothetical protein